MGCSTPASIATCLDRPSTCLVHLSICLVCLFTVPSTNLIGLFTVYCGLLVWHALQTCLDLVSTSSHLLIVISKVLSLLQLKSVICSITKKLHYPSKYSPFRAITDSQHSGSFLMPCARPLLISLMTLAVAVIQVVALQISSHAADLLTR